MKIDEEGTVFAGNGNIFASIEKVVKALIGFDYEFVINRRKKISVVLKIPFLMNLEHLTKLIEYNK